jgi:hypothetical protein
MRLDHAWSAVLEERLHTHPLTSTSSTRLSTTSHKGSLYQRPARGCLHPQGRSGAGRIRCPLKCAYPLLSTTPSTPVEITGGAALGGEAETLGEGCSAPTRAFRDPFTGGSLWKRDNEAPGPPDGLWKTHPGDGGGSCQRSMPFARKVVFKVRREDFGPSPSGADSSRGHQGQQSGAGRYPQAQPPSILRFPHCPQFPDFLPGGRWKGREPRRTRSGQLFTCARAVAGGPALTLLSGGAYTYAALRRPATLAPARRFKEH